MNVSNWIQSQTVERKLRMAEFVQESDKLSGLTPSDNEKGHFTALASCLSQFEERAMLTEKQLETWLLCIVPNVQIDEQTRMTLKKVADSCNVIFTELSPMSPENELLHAMSEGIWVIEQQTDLHEEKRLLGRLLAAGVAERCHHPIPIFYESMKKDYNSALRSRNNLSDFLSKIIRESVYNNAGELMKEVQRNGTNSTYIDPHGEKCIVQWHKLYET